MFGSSCVTRRFGVRIRADGGKLDTTRPGRGLASPRIFCRRAEESSQVSSAIVIPSTMTVTSSGIGMPLNRFCESCSTGAFISSILTLTERSWLLARMHNLPGFGVPSTCDVRILVPCCNAWAGGYRIYPQDTLRRTYLTPSASQVFHVPFQGLSFRQCRKCRAHWQSQPEERPSFSSTTFQSGDSAGTTRSTLP